MIDVKYPNTGKCPETICRQFEYAFAFGDLALKTAL
jgi:hypothetical protein